MLYTFKDANEREIQKMSEYVKEMIEEKWSKEEDQKLIQQQCQTHKWEIVHKGEHKIVRVCQECEKERFSYYTKEQLNYINKHIEDFAQPGSILYEKIYGKNR